MMGRRESKMEHAPVSGSMGKPFSGGESMGMPFRGASWVKSYPRECHWRLHSDPCFVVGNENCRSKKRGIRSMKNGRRSPIVCQSAIDVDSGGSSSCCY
jgi:hypothetical protein